MDPVTPGPIVQAKLELEAFDRLRDLVLAAGGIDLGLYKDRCVLRRLAVRQRACGAEDLRSYLKVVSRDPIERERLVKVLTIHVSQFFRNPGTFEAIRGVVLPAILAAKEAGGGRILRLWSAGSAAGEDAYSLAMLGEELAPHLASHMDINAIVDASGDAALGAQLQAGTALNLKRYACRALAPADWFKPEAENPYWILDTVEFKTAWHPIGV